MSGPSGDQTNPGKRRKTGESSESDISTRIDSLNDCIGRFKKYQSSLRKMKESGETSDSEVSTRIKSIDNHIKLLEELQSYLRKKKGSGESSVSDVSTAITSFNDRVQQMEEFLSSFKTRREVSGASSDSGVSFRSDRSKELPVTFRVPSPSSSVPLVINWLKESQSSPRSEFSSLCDSPNPVYSDCSDDEELDAADDLVESSDYQAGQRNVEQEVPPSPPSPPSPQRTRKRKLSDSTEPSRSIKQLKESPSSPGQQLGVVWRLWQWVKSFFSWN